MLFLGYCLDVFVFVRIMFIGVYDVKGDKINIEDFFLGYNYNLEWNGNEKYGMRNLEW